MLRFLPFTLILKPYAAEDQEIKLQPPSKLKFAEGTTMVGSTLSLDSIGSLLHPCRHPQRARNCCPSQSGSARRLGPYATQRLPGIRSRHGRRQIPVSSHKFDVDDAEPPINGADHENGSASGSEPKKMKVAKSPPASAGSRKRRGSVPRESSGSDHPPPSRKVKKIQRQDEEDDEVASDVSTPRHKSGDENTKGDEDQTSPKILVFPPEIPTQLETPVRYRHLSAAAALAALAVITDSVENNNDISLDLKHTAIISSPSRSRKSPVHEPPLLATLRHVRELHHPTTWIETKDLPSLIPSTEARERRDAHLQDLRSSRMIGGSLSNHQFGHPTRSSPSTSRYRVG